MGYNEQSLALYEAETAMAEERWQLQLEAFYSLAKAEGWGNDETANEYQVFENDPEDYFKEW
jgi:hypothetical protein